MITILQGCKIHRGWIQQLTETPKTTPLHGCHSTTSGDEPVAAMHRETHFLAGWGGGAGFWGPHVNPPKPLSPHTPSCLAAGNGAHMGPTGAWQHSQLGFNFY